MEAKSMKILAMMEAITTTTILQKPIASRKGKKRRLPPIGLRNKKCVDCGHKNKKCTCIGGSGCY